MRKNNNELIHNQVEEVNKKMNSYTMSKYYWQSVGEVVSQVYEIEAENWEEAKRVAFKEMAEGDILAECDSSAINEDSRFPEYHYIREDKCTQFTKLEKGMWAQTSGEREYWEDRAWSWSDVEDDFYNGNYEEFTDWKYD